jgi:hypothetical protein
MKSIKKSNSLSIALVVCLIFLLLFSQAAFALHDVRLSASTVTGVVGETVSVSINITNAMDTEGGQFDLAFDPDILEPVSATRGNFVPDVSGNIFDANLELADGSIRVLWVIAAGSNLASGTVGTIVFDVIHDGETNLTFSNVVMAPDEAVVGTHTSGKVTAEEVDAKQQAIDAANDAIEALPDPEDITLADKADVVAARALVNTAKTVHGAVDADFPELQKLVDAEAMIAKLEAIKAADDAILALPSVDSLTLDDKPDVVAARALVNLAKANHGAVDADFTYLSRLVAAENRIRELEGLLPTPPTGGAEYLFLSGLLLSAVGTLVYAKRRSLAVK